MPVHNVLKIKHDVKNSVSIPPMTKSFQSLKQYLYMNSDISNF